MRGFTAHRRLSRLLAWLVQPHAVQENLSRAYAAMARDEAREATALEWSEALLSDADVDCAYQGEQQE